MFEKLKNSIKQYRFFPIKAAQVWQRWVSGEYFSKEDIEKLKEASLKPRQNRSQIETQISIECMKIQIYIKFIPYWT